jgi:CRISPR/Cas system-associated exonuclease Cas4 (RecB family)
VNTLVISPDKNLIGEVLNNLRGDGRDYSSSLVVFPGKRPSHFLRKALAEQFKTCFIPPVILSMDEFIDSVCDELGPCKKMETLDAVAILHDIHSKSPVPLGGKGFMTPDSFFPLGLKIYRDLEELSIEGVKLEAVKGIESLIAENLPEETIERLQSLSYFYEHFFKRIYSMGFSTRSLRYQLVAEKISEAVTGKFETMIFAGFFALTNAEKSLFRYLLSSKNTLLIFQEGIGINDRLKDLGMAHKAEESECSKPAVHYYSSPDAHGQVLALGQVLKTDPNISNQIDEKTVIVLPSPDSLFPLMHQGLSAIPNDNFNISLGYQLHRTPVFGFLNNLMELVNSMDGDRIYIPDYLKFVLHPYAKNIYLSGKSETTRIMFHTIEEELLKNKAKTFTTIREIEESETLFKEIIKKLPRDDNDVTEERIREHLKTIHKNTIERFLSFVNIKDFAKRCIEVLVFLFNNSTAKLHPLFYPFSDSFITSMDLLLRSMLQDITFSERSSYFSFLRKYVMTRHTPFPGTPLKGLQVLGFLETRNLKFDTVFVLDANEDVLPNTRKEETLLPFKAREMLGLPTYLDRDRLTAYYFDLLVSGAKTVHFFFIENDKAERSRFIEKLLWEKQKEDKKTEAGLYIKPVQYNVKLSNSSPDAIAKTDEMIAFLRNFPYNATALNRYLKCPLQFYYASVLGFSRKEEITGDIKRDDLGNFVHAVLRQYFSDKKGKPLKEVDMDVGQMDFIVEDLFEKQYGEKPTGALYLLKRQIKRHMSDVLKNYYIPLVSEKIVTVLESEEMINISVGSFNLRGRIDNIEQRDDKTVIVDYKTGANQNYLKIAIEKLDAEDRETWSKAIGSLQLPFYMLLYIEKYNKPITDLNALFLLLGRSQINKEIELPLFDESSSVEIFEILKIIIFKLLKEVTDPSVPFSQAADKKKSCPMCDFQYICGTQWVM